MLIETLIIEIRNPTYSNMGYYSRNEFVDLFLKYEIAH